MPVPQTVHPENPAALPLPEMAGAVAALFADAEPPQRVRLLNGLLRPVGPLALVGISAGAFSALLPEGPWHSAQATLDDVARLNPSQVLDLARYVEQKSPAALRQALQA